MLGAILLWALGVYLLGVLALGAWAWVSDADIRKRRPWAADPWYSYVGLGVLWPMIGLWVAAQWFEALGDRLKNGSR